jgi:broad specificity polyphosphatase/5'/3'-nucleotidase SurE
MDGVATVATVANPLIVTDDEERAAAQAVVDGTPTDVVAFVS